jgi:ubiquinol-cytochrome c reductase cytochrome c subunit
MKTFVALIVLATSPAFAQNAENGKRLFDKLGCYTCHGHMGQGSAAGARLAPRTISAVALIAYVRHPAGSMPPFTAKVVSDGDLADIRAYLASVPAPPPLKDIPLLNQ